MVINSPFIRPHFLGGVGIGGVPLDFRDAIMLSISISIIPGCLSVATDSGRFGLRATSALYRWTLQEHFVVSTGQGGEVWLVALLDKYT